MALNKSIFLRSLWGVLFLGFICNYGAAKSYWWNAPNLKYVEVMDEETHGPSPHYWSFGGPSTTDSTSDQTYLYTSDSNANAFFSQYVVQELRDADNADQVAHRWATNHMYGLPKGSSQFGTRLVIGNGGQEEVTFTGYPDDYNIGNESDSWLEADVLPACDTLNFNHDGTYLYTNHYSGGENRMKIHRYKVTASLAEDGMPFILDTDWQDGGTFFTSLARLRNFEVKYIDGKDLIYYCEGDTLTKTSSAYVLDPETGVETLLVSLVFEPGEAEDADAVSVKIAGVASGEPYLYILGNIAGLKIYKLSSDGLQVENNSVPVAFITNSDLNDITGTDAFSSHCRAFEVTDDQAYAFFSSHNASDSIFVINTLQTAVDDWSIK